MIFDGWCLGGEVEGVIGEVVGNEQHIESDKHVAVQPVVVEVAQNRNEHKEDQQPPHPDGERIGPLHLDHPAVHVKLQNNRKQSQERDERTGRALGGSSTRTGKFACRFRLACPGHKAGGGRKERLL
eukprot:286154-Rhodomonas_salina.1